MILSQSESSFGVYSVISERKSAGECRDAYMTMSFQTFHSRRRRFVAGVRNVLAEERKFEKKMEDVTQCM